ncbi:unnamed protein product, partial [Polarella glacialis]
GAIPLDSNGDEIPDYYNENDKATRGPCSRFLDDFTMKLIPDTMCQWTTDSDFFIEVSTSSTIAPGDLVRLRPGTIYASKMQVSGVMLFSQPSSDFGVVSVPDNLVSPAVDVSGLKYMDTCTELTLDGSGSKDYGYRGPFVWALKSAEPPKSEPHMRQLQKLIAELTSVRQVQVLRIPPFLLQPDTTYNFTLEVQSFWDPALWGNLSHSVFVSRDAIPPL